jgi:hypothetical protein
VGAGASLAEAGDRTKKSLRPPLDSTFFQLCAAARLDGGATVRRYMHRQFGIDPFLPGYTMEAIFNFVYSDVFSSPRPPGALDAYWALVRMYSAAIARTTNRLRGVSRRGVGSLLRTIWPSDPDIVFITFNQDLLIEKALEAAVSTNSYADIPWNILTTYQRDFAAYLIPCEEPLFDLEVEGQKEKPSRSQFTSCMVLSTGHGEPRREKMLATASLDRAGRSTV